MLVTFHNVVPTVCFAHTSSLGGRDRQPYVLWVLKLTIEPSLLKLGRYTLPV